MPEISTAIITTALGTTAGIVSIYFMAEALNAVMKEKSAVVFG